MTEDRRHTKGEITDRAKYYQFVPNTPRINPYTYATPDIGLTEAHASMLTSEPLLRERPEKREHPIWTAARIRALRHRLGMSQAAFGAALGFTGKHRKMTINRYEHFDREPSAQTVILMEQLENKLPVLGE
jgi:DNA-binding transcriptional regulator YiaG